MPENKNLSHYDNYMKFLNQINDVMNSKEVASLDSDDIATINYYKTSTNNSDSLNQLNYELHVFALRYTLETIEPSIATLSIEKSVRDYYNDVINAYRDGVESGFMCSFGDKFYNKLLKSGKTEEEAKQIIEDYSRDSIEEIVNRYKGYMENRYKLYFKIRNLLSSTLTEEHTSKL